jgi:hypothetical protein
MKNKQKGFANLVLIGVVVFVAVLGYFMFFDVNCQGQSQEEIDAHMCPSRFFSFIGSLKKPVLLDFSDLSKDETVNWKTYTNEQYGFKFDYPEGYSISENTAFDALDDSSKFQVMVGKNISLEQPRVFEVLVKDAKQDPIKKTVDWFKKSFEGLIVSSENIDGSNFTILTLSNDSKSGWAYIEHNGFLYAISYTNESRHLLNTFKFIKPTEQVNNSKCGFQITSLSSGGKASFPLTISGVVDNSNSQNLGCAWQMFEGQAGIAQLYYKYPNSGWEIIGESKPIMVKDWTSNTTTFTTTLNFNNGGVGLQAGTPMKVVFTEENAAAIRPGLMFELPFILE